MRQGSSKGFKDGKKQGDIYRIRSFTVSGSS